MKKLFPLLLSAVLLVSTVCMTGVFSASADNMLIAQPTATGADPTGTDVEPTATGVTDILGDANNDGAVNMKDVLVLRKMLAGMAVTYNEQNADTNGDGAVNMKDVLVLRKFLAGILPTIVGTQTGTENEPTAQPTATATTAVPSDTLTYTVKTVESKEAIDWDTIPKAKVNTYRWVECTEFDTTAQLVYVKGFGFVCKMTCNEAEPVAVYSENDDPVWEDSCLEFFACYAGEEYINIECNANGAACIQIGTNRYDRVSLRDRFETPFVVTAKDTGDAWSVTSEIPLDKLKELYGDHVKDDLFVSGYTFTGNFYKTGGYETGNEHYAVWNEVKTEKPDFHQPAYFGTFVIE